MPNDKLLALLGFASKASAIGCGFEAVKESLKRKKARMVIEANDLSQKSRKEIAFFAKDTKIFTIDSIDSDTLSHAVGRKCAVVCINDDSFAKGCLKALNEGGNANDQ